MEIISVALLIAGGVCCYLLLAFQATGKIASVATSRYATFLALAFFVLRAAAEFVPTMHRERAIDFAVDVMMAAIICFVLPLVRVTGRKTTVAGLRGRQT